MIFLFAFIGGLLLNFLPCVLPVLALKAARGPWYVAGMMSIFMLLATLNVVLGLAWGEQFNSQPFAIAMTGLVFVMGLSFLGVWELPSFGFRGDVGSFGKGALATLLATPCSGPLLGPVFGATLGQHPITVYAIFACVGAGMALPYVLPIPLPKPGAWMVEFKQLGGWLLMGTTIWLLRAIDDHLLFPTLWTLLTLAAGCMFFNTRRLLAVLLTANAIAGIFLAAPSNTLPWQPYSPAAMSEARDKTVMVQFTAKWCLTCQINEAVLNTTPVLRAVARHGVVPLRAEMNNESAVLLRSLGYNSVPVLAIFHPGRAPIVLPDLISSDQVVEALR